jgi:nucleoid-associated protein YgaU
MRLEKATIVVLSPTPREPIAVLFNPFEYSIDRSNVFKATPVPGLSGPLIQFINGDADVLSMELFIDDYTDPPKPGEKSVKERLDEMALLLEIDPKLHAPAPVQFIWGKLTFKAIIEKLSRKITLFRPDGTPARATLNVTFKEYKTLPELVNDPRLESPDKTRRRVIVGYDSLWLLAAREYGDVAEWRVIAEHNDLDDPRDIAPGDWVMLPPLEPKDGPRGLL